MENHYKYQGQSSESKAKTVMILVWQWAIAVFPPFHVTWKEPILENIRILQNWPMDFHRFLFSDVRNFRQVRALLQDGNPKSLCTFKIYKNQILEKISSFIPVLVPLITSAEPSYDPLATFEVSMILKYLKLPGAHINEDWDTPAYENQIIQNLILPLISAFSYSSVKIPDCHGQCLCYNTFDVQFCTC